MDVKTGIKKFIVDNGIIGTMAGVAIALYTKDLILSFSGDIIIPLLNKLLLNLNIKSLTSILPHKVKFNMVLFFQNLISWFLGVLITYIFIQFTVNYLFGISGVEKDTDKKTDKDKDKDKDVQPKP
jgi:large-conductance mechanosensitive channel